MPNIEEHLRKAMQEGKFDNLPGKGKRLNLEQANPHSDPEWELAYHMLKESGFSLPWIETRNEVEKDLQLAREELQRAWAWRQAQLAEQGASRFIQAEWERAVDSFKEKIILLNKRIRSYNLQVPNARFQRPVVDFEHELEEISG